MHQQKKLSKKQKMKMFIKNDLDPLTLTLNRGSKIKENLRCAFTPHHLKCFDIPKLKLGQKVKFIKITARIKFAISIVSQRPLESGVTWENRPSERRSKVIMLENCPLVYPLMVKIYPIIKKLLKKQNYSAQAGAVVQWCQHAKV